MSFYSDIASGNYTGSRRGYVASRLPQSYGGRRFDEYYRCYPVVMMNGPDRSNMNYGGKVFLPSSALDKLTRLNITYPMLFELINGSENKIGHAGVLEFIAEEGRIYMPQWLMKSLALDPGDLIQVKSIDLPPGRFIKLQPQSPAFLDISDPRAVLENAFRNFSCLTQGDIFQFHYNDEVYDIKVLEVKPDTERHAVVTMETDLEVDFAEPVGYVAPDSRRSSAVNTPGSSRPGSVFRQGNGEGTMARSIGYDKLAPLTAEDGAKAVSQHFLGQGNTLKAPRKASKAGTPLQSVTPPIQPVPLSTTPTADSTSQATTQPRKTGPQPLRLPPGKLFFGYKITPPPRRNAQGEIEPIADDEVKPKFVGQGNTLSGRKAKPPKAESEASSAAQSGDERNVKLKGTGKEGRTLR